MIKIILVMLFMSLFLTILPGAEAIAWSNDTLNNFSVPICHQEFSDVTNCGNIAGQSTVSNPGGVGEENMIDGDFSTFDNAANFGNIITVNSIYYLPNFSINYSWEYKIDKRDGAEPEAGNITIPDSCINNNFLNLTIIATVDDIDTKGQANFTCDSTLIHQANSSVAGFDFYIYEEAMNWAIINFSDGTSHTTENLTFGNGVQNITRYLLVPLDVEFIINAFLNISRGGANVTDLFDRADNPTVGGVWEQFNNASIFQNRVMLADSSGATFPRINTTISRVERVGFEFNISDKQLSGFNGTNPALFLDKNGSNIIIIETKNDGLIYFVNSTGTHSFDSWKVNQTFLIELKNISFVTDTYDIYVNGVLNITNVSFKINANDMDNILIRTQTSALGIVFIDNITVNNEPPINPTLFIDKVNVWNFTGNFEQKDNRTNNLASILLQHLNSTFLVGSNYHIPFIFGADNPSSIDYLAMSFNNFGLTRNSITSVNNTFETKRETFVINISIDSDRYDSDTATFHYGTASHSVTRTASGNDRIYSSTIDIPLVNSSGKINNFYWEINLFEGETKTTSFEGLVGADFEFNQTVNDTLLTTCNSTYPTLSVNYTVYDEETLDLINSSFDVVFNWKLNESSLLLGNNSINEVSNLSHQFCININETFITSAQINLEASGYSDRTYTFSNESFSNVTTHQLLYLLNESDTSNIIIEVKDEGFSPLRGYTVKIFRINTGGGEDILVTQDITDVFGQIVAKLVEDDVKYKFEFFDTNNTLVRTVEDVVVACRATICIIPFVISDTTNDFDRFLYDECAGIEDLQCSLTFSNVTNTFTFTWVDTSGDSLTMRLFVERLAINGTQIICNNVSTSASSSLTCPVGGSIFSYRSQAFRKVGSTEIRLLLLNNKVGDEVGTFGLEGLMWGFILLFTMVMFGLWSPPVGISLYLAGVIMLGVTQIIYINPAIIIAQVAIGVLAIWALRQ